MLTFILFLWMPYARLINLQVRSAMKTEYVQAARAMGARGSRIMARHLLPNVMAPALVLAARDVGGVVVLACAFIFIGFGGNVAWGTILVTSRDYIIGVGGNPFEYWGPPRRRTTIGLALRRPASDWSQDCNSVREASKTSCESSCFGCPNGRPNSTRWMNSGDRAKTS